MICVTIGRTRHKMMLAEHRNLAERGAELAEIRIDWIARNIDVERLLKDRPTPTIITCRRPADGGRFGGSEDQRLQLIRRAIVAGVEYVDLEEDIAGKVPRYGKTKRIVSYHNFEKTPDDLEEIAEKLGKLDADIIKLATMANSPSDNVRMLKLVSEARIPTIGFCMGDYGIVSRVLCGRYGAPFTYATFSKERVMAPGQLAFDEMKKLYRFDDITPETAVFGVLGDPVAHSWSPLLHNAAFKRMGLNAVYLPLRVPPDEFVDTLKAYEFLDIRGYSVTIPHKEAALRFANVVDSASQEIGAANTLFKDPQNRWNCANTDYQAALDSIRMGLQQKGIQSLAGQRVLLLGAGGVARAIALGAVKEGAAVMLTNRSKDRGSKLAEELNCQFVTWANRGSVAADVIINCTPIGMYPHMDETPYEQYWFRDGMVVFDTIYNPENTLFLKEARQHECVTVSGVEMFTRQAAAQFELFTGQKTSLDDMRTTLRRGISPVRIKTETGHAAPTEATQKPTAPPKNPETPG